MQIIILGAGIIGVSTAWHLLRQGHDVTVIDRQPDAALETSFANAGQISVSHCEPWASRDTPVKLARWLMRQDAPLLFRPRMDWHQWSWGVRFLSQCNDAAFERNVRQISALGRYSHEALKAVVAATGIEYHRLERGIAHVFTDARAFEAAGAASELMRRFGVERRVVDTAELLRIEPALSAFGHRIVGGTYTASDETGDARVFTQALARRCAGLGGRFLWGRDVEHLTRAGGAVESVSVRDRATGGRLDMTADAFVVACGSWSAPLLRTAGVGLPIYPGKGYSATLRLLDPDRAPSVSVIDDEVKCAMTRLGDHLRVAGTIELGGWDASIDSPLSQARCRMLVDRVRQVLPGVCDLQTPNFWAGLRPATPTNIPFIGRTKLQRLWVNAGHGTLGWTHGAGSGLALAELMAGRHPGIPFGFVGVG
ncbi:MAG: D-amino acid dehydrogenase [Burkholderiaceae bacterium]|nr:D-amino acid dehydrogenase [Burkholderiaceae bacterium]